MVVGKFKDFQKYCSLHPDFQKAFAWLAEQKTDSSPDKILIDGEKVWGKVITDVNTDGEKFYEAHRDYIDIHYVLEGAEDFGYSHVEGLSVVQEYNPADDYGPLSRRDQPVCSLGGIFLHCLSGGCTHSRA